MLICTGPTKDGSQIAHSCQAYNERREAFELTLEDYPQLSLNTDLDHLDGILYNKTLPQSMSFLKEYRRYQDELWENLIRKRRKD